MSALCGHCALSVIGVGALGVPLERVLSGTVNDWDSVAAEVRRLVAASAELFDASTVHIADDVMSALRGHFPVPEVFTGYWSTIRFCWGDSWEIECHRNHVELYCFKGQLFDIQYFDHAPGNPLPMDLLKALALPPSK